MQILLIHLLSLLVSCLEFHAKKKKKVGNCKSFIYYKRGNAFLGIHSTKKKKM